jgi:CheY-like chemotaxis protein/HPt (histidine-containing phosphotransfer) domain-containing protein
VEVTLIKPVRRSHLFRAMAEDTARGTPRGSHVGQLAPASDGKVQFGLSVLLVEDQEINRTVAARMLEQLGCRVVFAVNGRQAVDALTDPEADCDVVLMDVQMPLMDGLEATEQIRFYERETGRRRIPIIAMTAHALEGDRERCLQAGMDDYLSKPVRRNDLIKALGRWSIDRAPTHHHATLPAQPDSSPQLRTFDLESLTELCGGDHSFVHELATKFLETAIPCLERIRSAQDTDDGASLADAALALRGVCLTVGAGLISEYLQRVESLGRRGETFAAAPLIARVFEEWGRLRIELDDVVAV